MTGADNRKSRPKAKLERPDPAAANRPPRPGAEDRPGFDLGGATEREPSGPTTGNVVPGGPRTEPKPGGEATGRADGRTRVSGSRSLGEAGKPGSASGVGATDGSGRPS